MFLIVGLGNIGQKYASTRHNIGFMVLDQLSNQWSEQPNLQALTSRQSLENQEVILAKPTTMMNSSGQAVSRLAQFYKIAPEDIWVIYDELDLPLGKLKISQNRGDNGHNGTISIRRSLGHNRFLRFRIGVDTREHREIPGLDYVLQPITPQEDEVVRTAVSQAAEAVRLALREGAERAIQRYNSKQ